MTSNELRKKYLDFFKEHGHAIIPSASLIPDNDPTVLFTTAGMHPLVPYLMGEKHPSGARLTDVQKCIRTSDIDEVGDSTHHTFFEMLGNWSLGDYFKEEAIKMSWEFLTSPKWLNLDKNRLAVSVFTGDDDAPFDQEAFDIWKKLGMSEERIAKLPKKNNWWGPAGITGPCGPDTEMFYWVGDPEKVPTSFNDDNPLWVEIWNDVFMQYNKTTDGTYEPLKQKNVDTGMGMERVLAALNGFDDNYKTELFKNLIFRIENLSGKNYDDSPEIKKAMRIIADHLKAATFIMGDDKGIGPSNTDRGYIVRRLIRRAIRYGRQLGITESPWTKEIAKIVAHDYALVYPELQKNINRVIEQFKEEEIKFGKTLEQGLKEFEKMKPKFTAVSPFAKTGIIEYGWSGNKLFNLYATYGFPIELSIEEIKKLYRDFKTEKGITIPIVELPKEDEERLTREFHISLEKHQDLSRTASAGMFKGGLADASEATIKYHTAAHLLLASLRKVLGDHVVQKGSNITAERLRFDFAHQEKMTDEEKKKVEDMVNQAIKDKLNVSCEEMTLDEAREKGAHGIFDAKYGEKVNIYTIGDEKLYFSKEICGGPHVKNTAELGQFKIQKEESSSSGVRRIKAILQ
ncbi:MAG: alanine--tRNA ligase [Patescibacteria group bacterium]|jgi:alanyl-tRNA synthetase